MRCASVVALVLLAACPGKGTVPTVTTPPPPPKPVGDPTANVTLAPGTQRPKLVVLLVVDQLPAWSFAHKRGALTGGFDRLLREGEWHTGEHPSAATQTAPGHALLGTGEPTARSGILANEWWDRAAGKPVRAAEDLDGKVSAAWLRVPGLGDSVAAAATGAKAVSVALKDRASVLPLGHAGTAVYYESETGTWHSTTNAAWVTAYDKAHPVAPRLKEAWTPLDAAKLAALSKTVDDAPHERGEKGFGRTFPHVHTATKAPLDSIFATPLGHELTFDMALAAIAGEGLGTDDTADLLIVSLSSHDLVGHGWGHESWEAWDMLLRLDAQLAKFLDALDAKVGKDRWAMVLTSDHGASPAPALHGGGGINYPSIADAANRAAITQLGQGEWIAYAKFPTVYLTAAAKAKPPKELRRALIKIVYALRSFPGLARVELVSDIAGDCSQRTGDLQLLCLAVDPERSGEVFYMPKPNWIMEDRPDRFTTAHGSIHAHDREVPVILVPPGRTAHAPIAAPSRAKVQMTNIAAVIAGYLGVEAPVKLPR